MIGMTAGVRLSDDQKTKDPAARPGPGNASGRDRAGASELEGQASGDGLTVCLDVAEGEFSVGTIFEFRDPALGAAHALGDVFLRKLGAQPLADELRDDHGPLAGDADASGGLGRNDACLTELFDIPVAGRADRFQGFSHGKGRGVGCGGFRARCAGRVFGWLCRRSEEGAG